VFEDINSPEENMERIMKWVWQSRSHNQELHANINEHCNRGCARWHQRGAEVCRVHHCAPAYSLHKNRKEDLHVLTIQMTGKKIGLFGIGFN